mmetsp:Transcript_133144/g.425969  ORF Transcript_133144/g.425969 Transcript_133144/m.425969 type:complete len:146 (+) Transcript_133144:424-861(+)
MRPPTLGRAVSGRRGGKPGIPPGGSGRGSGLTSPEGGEAAAPVSGLPQRPTETRFGGVAPGAAAHDDKGSAVTAPPPLAHPAAASAKEAFGWTTASGDCTGEGEPQPEGPSCLDADSPACSPALSRLLPRGPAPPPVPLLLPTPT